MKLYQIPLELQDLANLLEETGGEWTPDIEEHWNAVRMEGAAKIEAAACVLKNMAAEEAALKAEEERLAARRKSVENQQERLKALLLPAVQALGGKVKGTLFTISSQTRKFQAIDLAPGAIIWDLPQDWYRVRDPELCKTVIKDALKAGVDVPPQLVVSEIPTTFVVVR